MAHFHIQNIIQLKMLCIAQVEELELNKVKGIGSNVGARQWAYISSDNIFLRKEKPSCPGLKVFTTE